jgi:hypothetical protein
MRAHGSLLLPHLRRLRQWEHLQGIPDWPAAKNPGDVDTVDHLVASLYDVVSGPAGQRDWTASARCLCPTVGLPGLFRSLRPQRMHRHARVMPFS